MPNDSRKQHHQCKQDEQMHQDKHPNAHVGAKNVVEAGMILFPVHLMDHLSKVIENKSFCKQDLLQIIAK